MILGFIIETETDSRVLEEGESGVGLSGLREEGCFEVSFACIEVEVEGQGVGIV